MLKEMSTEVKVGIFVVLGFLVLAYMTVNIEKIRFGKAVGYKIYAKFDSAAGLVKNSDVRIAGVQVGMVEHIELDTETKKAKVTLRFPLQITLPVDSLAFVKSEGLLGEKYIEIQSGSLKDKPIQQGDEIKQGASPVDMNQLFGQLSSVAADVKGVTHSLNRALGGEEGERYLKRIFDDMGEITSDLKTTVRENREDFTIIMGNLEDITREMAGISSKARDTFSAIDVLVNRVEDGEGTLGMLMADNSLYDQTRDTMANLNKITERVEDGEGTLGMLLADESLFEETRDTLESLKRIAKNIEHGEGTLGKLVTDEALYAEAKKAVKKVNKATEAMADQIPFSILGTVLGPVLR